MQSPESGGPEPIVRDGDKIMVACPDCGIFGSHTGTCNWSLMRSGRIWAFYAQAVELVVAPLPVNERGELVSPAGDGSAANPKTDRVVRP